MSAREAVFVKRLKTARLRLGYSQRRLGIELGIDPSVASARMNQYERGRREPALTTTRQIANLLKVPLEYLFCDDDDTAELLLLIHDFDNTEKKALLAAAKKISKTAKSD